MQQRRGADCTEALDRCEGTVSLSGQIVGLASTAESDDAMAATAIPARDGKGTERAAGNYLRRVRLLAQVWARFAPVSVRGLDTMLANQRRLTVLSV